VWQPGNSAFDGEVAGAAIESIFSELSAKEGTILCTLLIARSGGLRLPCSL
jgi:hypothetical protein